MRLISKKVIQVPPTPVYDLSVPELENFVLAKGVVVHNSKDCLSGDTLIPLLNGAASPIKDLVGLEFWVYSALPNGRIVPAKARNVHKVSTQKVLRITLDSGESLTCTPDHEIMLRDGSFIEAKDLKMGIRLMPLQDSRSVASIEYLTDPVDVYDMTVDGTHNFAINSGIFVHNCADSLASVIAGLISRREIWAHFGIPPIQIPEFARKVINDKKDTEKV